MSSKDDNRSFKQHLRVNNSFIKRNRALSSRQNQLYQVSYEKWGLSTDSIWNFNEIFTNQQDVILEIGFGRGDTLLKNAVSHPDNNYIGIEVYRAGILHILTTLAEFEKNNSILNNLKVCNADAKLILNYCIPDGTLAGVQIYFPDPWPKRKHVKRRLIQEEFITLLAKKMQKGGILHLATDWAGYAEQMLQVLTNSQFYSNLSQDGAYHENENRLLTRFEQRGLSKGHKIFDLKFKVI